MKNVKILPTPELLASKVIVRGIHLDITPALYAYAEGVAERLLRHNEHLIRVRLDIELDRTRAIGDQFIAKGHLEIRGPDLIASVESNDAYKSLDLLADKLDSILRRLHGKHKNHRHDNAAEVVENSAT
ncbi:MAG: ribosome-associated translation inhibitor RaiA [Opitutaceae bacterium]|jgi:putative sigma-54 modulation protein